MQTRRKTQAPRIKSEAVKLKRAPAQKRRRLLSFAAQKNPAAQLEQQLSARSPSSKRNVKGEHEETPSPLRRRKSGTQASNTARSAGKGIQKRAPPSTAPSGRKEHESEKKDMEDQIIINRAPVLTLWVAVVATREGYTYEEGLSFGKAIAGLMAQSKGRSLGIYKDPSEEKKEERKRKRKDLDKFRVFGMNVVGKTTQEGHQFALQGGKPISPAAVANYLHGRFGANLERAKGAMEDLANSFPSQEIGGIAYSLYEKFRPTVSHGVKGWGAKGFLDIDSMRALRKQ